MKIFTGKVVSKKMAKTATVLVERVVTHPVYGKKIKRNKNYQVHDELGVEVGKTVLFAPSRPYSRLKRWKIIKVVEDGNENNNSGKVIKGRSSKGKKEVKEK